MIQRIAVLPENAFDFGVMSFDGSRLEYYRSRARALRQYAAIIEDLEIRLQFVAIAEQYERLALEVEKGVLRR